MRDGCSLGWLQVPAVQPRGAVLDRKGAASAPGDHPCLSPVSPQLQDPTVVPAPLQGSEAERSH